MCKSIVQLTLCSLLEISTTVASRHGAEECQYTGALENQQREQRRRFDRVTLHLEIDGSDLIARVD